MPLTLSCLDLGSPCDTTVSGDSTDAIIDEMCQHAINVHGKTREEVYSEDNRALFRSALKQSSRPSGLRSPRLDV
jgi:predicted small metal-binding protein